jgi:hypothetical protein
MLETFYARLNEKNIGIWRLHQEIPQKIIVDFEKATDTLSLIGASDCGALDGTIIKIKFKDSLVLKLTRISSGGILRHDTVMINWQSTEKQSFLLDPVVSFYVTKASFQKLDTDNTYSIYFERITDRNAKEVHIFDMQLK